MKNNKAFTLMELIVAIVIMGILMALALPQIRQIQTGNRNRKYTTYGESLEEAAKLYVDSNEIDLFDKADPEGCRDIFLSELIAKKLAKEYKLNGVVCDPTKSYVHITKSNNKFSYSYGLICKDGDKEVFNNTSEVTLCPASNRAVGIDVVVENRDQCTKSKKATIFITSRSKLLADIKVTYHVPEDGPGTLINFNNRANTVTELVRDNITLSGYNGEVRIKVVPTYVGSSQFNLLNDRDDVVIESAGRFDNTPPGAPSFTNKTVSGTAYNNGFGTWVYNGFNVVPISVDGTNGCGIKSYEYKLGEGAATWTPMTKSENAALKAAFGTDVIYTYKIPDSDFNGKLLVRSIDVAGNESAVTSKDIKIDRTVPTITNLTYASGKVTATAKDTGSGVRYYLLSDKSNLTAANVKSSGTSITATATASISITVNFTGTRYLYVEDEVGNFTKQSIAATTITLDDRTDVSNSGTTAIYTVNAKNVYLDSNRTKAMTASANPITTPKIAGYKFDGYYSAASGGTIYITATGYINDAGLTAGKGYTSNQTWYAHRTQCAAGTYSNLTNNTCTACPTAYPNSAAGSSSINSCYLNTTAGKYVKTAGAGQVNCESGYYCTGGTKVFYNGTGGRSSCPSGYGTSAAGATAASGCYLTTTAGKYIATAKSSTQTTCTANYYCPATKIYYGSTGGRTACPSGYGTSAAGATAASGCYLTTTAGKYIATAKSSTQTTCTANYYCAATKIYYGSTGGRTACPSGYGTSAAGATAASGCYLTTTAGKYIATAKSSTQTTCTANYYCAATKIYYGSTGGRTACPSGYGTSAAGATAASGCYLTTTAGKYIATAKSSTQTTCTANYYCAATKIYYGSTGGRTACPSGYGTSAAGATAASGCYLTTTAGKYIATAKSSTQTTCTANYYCPSANIYYGSTGSRISCGSGKTSPAGSSAASACVTSCTNVNATRYYGCTSYYITKNCNGTCHYSKVNGASSTGTISCSSLSNSLPSSCTPRNCDSYYGSRSGSTVYYTIEGTSACQYTRVWTGSKSCTPTNNISGYIESGTSYVTACSTTSAAVSFSTISAGSGSRNNASYNDGQTGGWYIARCGSDTPYYGQYCAYSDISISICGASNGACQKAISCGGSYSYGGYGNYTNIWCH